MKRALAGAAALIVLLAGCGSQAAPAAVTSTAVVTTTAPAPAPTTVQVTTTETTAVHTTASVTVTATKSATATVTVSVTASPSPSSAATSTDGPAKLGVGQPGIADGSVLTALEFTAKLEAEPAPEDGYRWSAALVKNCFGTGNVADAFTSNQVWRLIDAEDGQYEPSSSTYESFPSPQYPIDAPIMDGECAQGWIVFRVPTAAEITEVRYARTAFGDTPAVVRKWATS